MYKIQAKSQGRYTYRSVTVKLENFDLSHVPVYVMNEETLGRYAIYMATLGNRPDLFPDSDYIRQMLIEGYTKYDLPPEALENTRFATMIKEAEKYLGYPYVWGGSSPSTSFDCSGFVCWVLNHSGWSVGRTSAQGLYNLCTPVSRGNARPGDLVFFKGTYKTNGVSHVGIYVGENRMIHCGNPISYTNINTNTGSPISSHLGVCPDKERDSMNPKLQKLRAELEKNTEKIEKLQSRNTELKKQIQELENIDIIYMVRECGLSPEALSGLLAKVQASPKAADTKEKEDAPIEA